MIGWRENQTKTFQFPVYHDIKMNNAKAWPKDYNAKHTLIFSGSSNNAAFIFSNSDRVSLEASSFFTLERSWSSRYLSLKQEHHLSAEEFFFHFDYNEPVVKEHYTKRRKKWYFKERKAKRLWGIQLFFIHNEIVLKGPSAD
jgi:hypothetical protein